MTNTRQKIEYSAIALVLLAIFFITLSFHTNYQGSVRFIHEPNTVTKLDSAYPYPMHGDEWVHLAQGRYIIESSSLPFKNPYDTKTQFHANLESGFDMIIAEFFMMTGLDPVRQYYLLPAIFTTIVALLLIGFTVKLTKKIWIGISAAIFFVSIKSNINILGFWFFLPIVLGILLLYGYLSIPKKDYLLKLIVFGACVLSYPLICPIILVYEVFMHKNDKKSLITIILGGILALILATIILGWSRLSNYLIVYVGWTETFETFYNPIAYYGLISTLFAVIGLVVIIQKGLPKLLIYIAGFLILNILLYAIFKFSILIPYQRSLLLLLVTASLFSGIGFYSVVTLIMRYKDKVHALFINGLLGLFICITVFFLFNKYHVIDDTSYYPILYFNDADYAALGSLNSDLVRDSIIMTPPGISFSIYPTILAKTTELADSNLGFGDYQYSDYFYRTDCATRLNMTQYFNVTYIYSLKKLNCSWMGELYSNPPYIYEVE